MSSNVILNNKIIIFIIHIKFLIVFKLLYLILQRESFMDLGIKGKKAIVCASSRGLGFGCAEALAKAGVSLTICARTKEAVSYTHLTLPTSDLV